MQFLDDVQVKSVTCNSLSSTANASINEDSCSTVTNDESLMSLSVPLPMDSGGSSSQSVSGEIVYDSNKKRKLGKSSKSDEKFHESVIAALREPIAQPDGTSAFLITLGEGLRKLPYRKRTELEIKFLSMVLEEQDNLVNVT